MSDHDLGTYQMLWNCSACGTEKLLGLEHRHCPGCGAAQDEDARYFPSDADKVTVQDHVYVGADRECGACGSPMAAVAKHCTNCGCGLDDAEAVDRVTEAPPKPAAPPPPSKSGGCGKVILLAIVALVVLLGVMILWKKPIDAEATGKAWTRQIDVEVYGPVKRSAWCDSLPSRARNITRTQEVRERRRVADGETCVTAKRDNGDGSFTEYQDCKPKYREEPVFADKCSFTVDAWTRARTVEAKGGAADAPKWPDPTLKREGSCVGCERPAAKREAYTVTFEPGEGGAFDCPFPEATWASIELGSAWTSEQSVLSGASSCSALKAQ